MLANHMSDEGATCRIYKDLSRLNNKKRTNPTEKMGQKVGRFTAGYGWQKTHEKVLSVPNP